jgi:hypothetical protein
MDKTQTFITLFALINSVPPLPMLETQHTSCGVWFSSQQDFLYEMLLSETLCSVV